MKKPVFAQKETDKATRFFSKVSRQPLVKPDEYFVDYTVRSSPLKVKVKNKTVKIYRKNKKIFQFTNNKLSDVAISINPQSTFVAIYGNLMNTDISHLYLFDVSLKKIVYKTHKAFLTFEWHKGKLLIAGREAVNFTEVYGIGHINELSLQNLQETEVYQSQDKVILYLQKHKQQLYINELKTQFNSYFLLSDDYQKQQVLDLHHKSKQMLISTKNQMWRIKHTFRKPFGELQKIDFNQDQVLKNINFKGWVTLDESSDNSSEIFILSQMNTQGEIRIISLNQNGTIKDLYQLPTGTTIDSMYYNHGYFQVSYSHLAKSGKILVNCRTGLTSHKIVKITKQLNGLTVQLKKHGNSWIYLYQIGSEPLNNRPTLIYTYGGFGVEPGVNLKDYYAFLKEGGIIAEVCPRGGIQEVFRYRWNTSRGHKEKTINDVIKATKYLLERGIAQSGHIGLTGASNGGFVVGAVINKAPHLYRAVLSEVGVMDLANYENYTGGDVWSCEYGTTQSKLKKLSPVENIKYKQYPAIYVVSGQYDTRVAPIHQIKYTKALKAHGHKVLFQSFPEGHSIYSRILAQNTVKFFTHFLLNN